MYLPFELLEFMLSCYGLEQLGRGFLEHLQLCNVLLCLVSKIVPGFLEGSDGLVEFVADFPAPLQFRAGLVELASYFREFS